MPRSFCKNFTGPVKWDNVQNEFIEIRGIYIISIRCKKYLISYPRKKSNIIYIGRSENIGKRLWEHYYYKKNWGLYNYIDYYPLNVHVMELQHGNSNVKKHENKTILSFENEYGCAPICNLQTANPNL